MATEEQEGSVKTRKRGRGRTSRPTNDANPSIFKVLWADLRRKELPGQPDPVDQEWLEEQREMRRQESARIGRVSSMSEEQLEQWRKRYWQSAT